MTQFPTQPYYFENIGLLWDETLSTSMKLLSSLSLLLQRHQHI